MTRQLVVTADDLGLGPATNEAIVDLMERGSVTSTTLMAVAPGAPDAVRRVRAAGLADPRLHVTLTSARELRPWAPLAADVPSLTDHRGRFHVDPGRFEIAASADEVDREMTAQLGWMTEAGLRPTALDSHSGSLYSHRGGPLMDTALRFCAENSLGFRLPRRLPRLLDVAVRGPVRRRFDEAVAAAGAYGVRLPETIIGAWLPGRLLTGYAHLRWTVLRQLRALPDGVSELIMHPAPAAAARNLDRAEGRKRMWELRVLQDPLFLRTLRSERIQLVPGW
jgi:chitin disaccharide deacetylase